MTFTCPSCHAGAESTVAAPSPETLPVLTPGQITTLSRLVEFLRGLTDEQSIKIHGEYIDDHGWTLRMPARDSAQDAVKKAGLAEAVETWQDRTTGAVRQSATANGATWASGTWAVADAANDAVLAIVDSSLTKNTAKTLLAPVVAGGFIAGGESS